MRAKRIYRLLKTLTIPQVGQDALYKGDRNFPHPSSDKTVLLL